MKIQIRRGATAIKPGTVRVREKTLYHCKECGNKYYAYHLFCPQCLGEVTAAGPHKNILLITSYPGQLEEAADSIQRLMGKTEFDVAKALRTLPWVFIMNTDREILRHWKECFDATKIKSEILATVPVPRKKRKPAPPVFDANAPFPHFFSQNLTSSLRASTKEIANASAKLRWIETVLLSFHILERLYKHPTGTILFYDFIFQIEQQLTEFIESLRTTKWSESSFLKRIGKLKDSLERMETEIEAVGQQVQEQL